MPEKNTKPRKKLDYPKLVRKFYYPRNNYKTAIKILSYLEIHRLPTTLMISKATVNNRQDTKISMEFLKKLGYCEEYGIVSNPDHSCIHCKKSTQYVTGAESIKSSMKLLEDNHKLKLEDQEKPNFDPSNYFPFEKNCVFGRHVWLECKKCRKHNDAHKEVLFKVGQNRMWSITARGKHLFLVIYKGEKLTEFMKNNLDDKVFELIFALKQSGEKRIADNLISKLNRTKHDDDDLIFEKILNDWFEIHFDKVMRENYSDSLHEPLVEYQKKHYFDYTAKRIQISRRN